MTHSFSRMQPTPSAQRSRLHGLMLALIWGGLGLPLQTGAISLGYSDNEVKAVFLYHFTSFIKWPEDAFPSADAHFRICTSETNPINEKLLTIIAGESVDNRSIELHTLSEGDQATSCQILYVSMGDNRQLLEHLRESESRTLTVSDDTEFIKRGGMIKLHLQAGRVRPVIHKARLDNAHLKASAKLLQLATLVSD